MRKIPKRWRRFVLFVIGLSIVSASYLTSGIVSYYRGPEITINQYKWFRHPNVNGYYRIRVIEGEIYNFSVQSTVIMPQLQIKLYSRSFKTFGEKVTYDSLVAIEFTAEHDGHYYVTVSNSEGGTFAVRLELLSEYTNWLEKSSCVSTWNFLLFLVLISMIIATTVFTIDYRSHKAEEDKFRKMLRNSKMCPMCGIRIQKDTGYCNICGYTFVPPQEFKNY